MELLLLFLLFFTGFKLLMFHNNIVKITDILKQNE